jgi:hypothetical protein
VADAADVRSLLTSTARDLGPAGRDKLYGFGLADAAAATTAAGPAPASVFVGLSTDQTRYDESATTALVTLTVKNETGAPLSGLAGDQFASTFDDAPAALSFVESATPGTYTAALDITGLSGQHALNVQVASDGVTGDDTAAFVIAAPPVPGTVHVSSIDYEMGTGRDRRTLLITVTTVDGNGAPVANAAITVVIYLNGVATWLGQGGTDSTGQLTFGLPNAPAGTYYTEVWGVAAGALTWDDLTPPNGFTR